MAKLNIGIQKAISRRLHLLYDGIGAPFFTSGPAPWSWLQCTVAPASAEMTTNVIAIRAIAAGQPPP
jgi:hypothetical protein